MTFYDEWEYEEPQHQLEQETAEIDYTCFTCGHEWIKAFSHDYNCPKCGTQDIEMQRRFL